MKSLLERIKQDIKNDAVLASYLKAVQIVGPDVLPDVSTSLVPFVGIAPISTSESWFAMEQQHVHTVRLYMIQSLMIKETAIIGTDVDRGLLQMMADVETVVRAKFFARDGLNYLSKPSEITNVDYSLGGYGDQIYTIVGIVTLQCIRLSLQAVG